MKAVGWALIGLGLAFLVAAAIAMTPPAGAHGDAQWIMDDPATSYCCGPDDCWRLPPGAVAALGDAWLYRGRIFRAGAANVHPSRDGAFWACHGADGSVRCFFYPLPGV